MTDDLFPPGFEPPAPPPGLRERSLSAASRAFDAAPERDAWTRIFESPALRLAWAASVVLLAAAHARVPARPVMPAGPDALEIRQLAHLPRIDSRSLPDEAPPSPARSEERS